MKTFNFLFHETKYSVKAVNRQSAESKLLRKLSRRNTIRMTIHFLKRI